jgi:MtaA/CmuA family methyltransferase
MTSRERVLATIAGAPADRLPVMPMTMMFAAEQADLAYGRYALDYRVLVESQLRTVERFGFDHVSTITETREARDCGATIRYFDNQPYALDESVALLADKSELKKLQAPDPYTAPSMADRLEAIRRLRAAVGQDLIVEGWVEGPTGASADLRGINTLMLDFMDDPGFVHDLYEFSLDLALRFGRAQAEAGADVVGIGNPAASLIGPKLYREFDFPYAKRLVDSLHAAGLKVRCHICGNTRRILPDLAQLGFDIVDVDSAVKVADARAGLGPEPALLGGIDPVRVLQTGTPDAIHTALAACHQAAGNRYIVGAGCEVPPGTPAANIRAMVDFATRG